MPESSFPSATARLRPRNTRQQGARHQARGRPVAAGLGVRPLRKANRCSFRLGHEATVQGTGAPRSAQEQCDSRSPPCYLRVWITLARFRMLPLGTLMASA